MIIVHDLYKSMTNVDVCTEFESLEIKVSLIFFDTKDFSSHKDER